MQRHVITFVLGIAAVPAVAQDLETALNARYRGGWVVVHTALQSDCAGFYTDNELRAGSVVSKGDERFAAGELARVERVDPKRERIDVFLDLTETILEQYSDGPFTLYTERACKAQLKIPVPSRALADRRAAVAALGELLELHPSAEQAQASPAWNRRRRADYPADYERTLAEHAAWRAAQVNAEVQARIDHALDEARRAMDRLAGDSEALESFAAGVRARRDQTFRDCDDMLASDFASEGANEAKDREAFVAGERLAYWVTLARELEKCFVLPPPVPAPS
jgi:hypothetical protein